MEGSTPEAERSLPLNASVASDDVALQSLITTMKQEQVRLANRTAYAAAKPMTLRQIPHVGSFMIPSDNSWAAHRELIQDTHLGLQFDPEHVACFDGILAHHQPSAMLQENIAILRNYLMGEFFTHTPSEEKLTHLIHIAGYLGESLGAASAFNLWHHALDKPRASVPGKGIQYLYLALLKKQHAPIWLNPSLWFAKHKPSHWHLPPLEATPFSDANLQKAPPRPDTCITNAEQVEIVDMSERNHIDPQTVQADKEQSAAEQLNEIANDMASAGALSMSVEQLQEPTKRESVRLAKDILDKLRVKLGEALVGNGLDMFGAENLSILGLMKEAVKTFEFHLHKLAGLDPNTYDNPAVMKANEAVGKLSYIAKQETLKAAISLGDEQMIAVITSDLAQLPASWIPAEGELFKDLLNDLESGLESVMERITQIGDQDHTAEFWLGFSNQKSIGANDPSKGKNDKPEKAMSDDQYFRQLMAQRAVRARQAAIRYTQSMQRMRQDDGPPGHDHPRPQPKQESANLSGLLGKDQINAMRNAMKTSANAAAVQTGSKANIQNVIHQKEQAVRAQRQRVTVEQVTRANKRTQEMQEDRVQPPPGKKKDHTHGI